MRAWLCLSAIAALSFGTSAEARYEQVASVSVDEGARYRVPVTFVTGVELNQATHSISYDGFGRYAVIFWKPGEASVIHISTPIICGTEFDEGCLPLTGRMRGADQEGRQWQVCTGMACP